MNYMEIRIPQLAKNVDCRLEEHVKISVLLCQLSEFLLGRKEEGMLFLPSQKKVLVKEQTLAEQGVLSGQTLLLLFV